MIGGINIKVCGITRVADVIMALAYGTDFIGVNCWSGSPRFVPLEVRANLLHEIPLERRVAVTVNPSPIEASSLIDEGFAIVQAHFDPSKLECDPLALSAAIGNNKLWLAPKLADGASWPHTLLPLASGFIHDAHSHSAFGGTGRLADWNRFQQLLHSHPESKWILAGGLGPQNLESALNTGATFVDLNSGIEIKPGLKSAEKIYATIEIVNKYTQSKT